jgi:hypothetical protein
MLIVFLVVFIDLLGFGIVLPLLPRYVQTFTAGMSAAGVMGAKIPTAGGVRPVRLTATIAQISADFASGPTLPTLTGSPGLGILQMRPRGATA